jgi:uncharacterized membrane protein YidH (DUF202 family)
VRTGAAERTQLAWERSVLGPLAAAALLLAKPVDPLLGRVLLAVADVLLALAVLALGERRRRRIGVADADPAPPVPDAGREVAGVAVAAAALGLGTAVLLAVQA